MSTGGISDEALTYFEKRRIRALLDEAMRDVLMAMPADPLAFLESAFQQPTPLRLIVVGLPGCGKSTQCARLAEHYGIRCINTVDLADDAAVGEESAAAAAAADTAADGEGVPIPEKALVQRVVAKVRQAEEEGVGWVLGDFPRTRAQAIYLQSAGISPQRFIFLDVPEDVCAGWFLDGQPDSSPAALKNRFEYFAARKEEILDCYRPFCVHIDGNRDPDEVFNEICAQCDAIDIAK